MQMLLSIQYYYWIYVCDPSCDIFILKKKFHGSLDPVIDILVNYEFPHHFPMSFISFRKNSDDNVYHLTIKRVSARGANIDGVLSVNQILLKGLM